jgi:oxygen-independent coproporphyrinogen-3 oxidase
MKNRDWHTETLYIGGGTPTFLREKDLAILLEHCLDAFGSGRLKELTVEAGRPDTLNAEKLKILSSYGVNRICLNPQSMKDDTLRRIGRDHDKNSVLRAFNLVRDAGIQVINSDIIAGLPDELPEDFRDTLDALLSFSPENITVHTLALKRAAKLKEQDEEYHYKRGEDAEKMLKIAEETLLPLGFEPYYLYRQKKTAGNLENIGYAKDRECCLYNMRIMEEDQTILALGAGGSTKVYYPEDNRIERIFNVSDYQLYIERIDEMMGRKKNLFYGS